MTHRPVARQEGAAGGGVHEHQVLIGSRVYAAGADEPAESAPVIACVLMEFVAPVWWQEGKLQGRFHAIALSSEISSLIKMEV